MTCKEFIDFMLEYFEDDLTKGRRKIFEQHMNVCADCVAYMESYRKTVELVQNAGLEDNDNVDPKIPKGLIEAILATKSK
jgi:hypothetical protein